VAAALVIGLLIGAGATYILVGRYPSQMTTTVTETMMTDQVGAAATTSSSSSNGGASASAATTTSSSSSTESASASAATTTTTATGAITNSTLAVTDAYTSHLQDIKSENLDAIVSDYESNATIDVTGVGGVVGIGGTYAGASSIRSLYDDLLFEVKTTVNLANMSYTVDAPEKGAAVNSNFTIYGDADGFVLLIEGGCTSCVYVSNISEHVSYAHLDNDSWLISSETLDFHTFNVCGEMSDTKCSMLLSAPQFSGG
jgi:hypothetical protein